MVWIVPTFFIKFVMALWDFLLEVLSNVNLLVSGACIWEYFK